VWRRAPARRSSPALGTGEEGWLLARAIVVKSGFRRSMVRAPVVSGMTAAGSPPRSGEERGTSRRYDTGTTGFPAASCPVVFWASALDTQYQF
jgi:hypothetical protein